MRASAREGVAASPRSLSCEHRAHHSAEFSLLVLGEGFGVALFLQGGDGLRQAVHLAVGPAMHPVHPAYPLDDGGADTEHPRRLLDGKVEGRRDRAEADRKLLRAARPWGAVRGPNHVWPLLRWRVHVLKRRLSGHVLMRWGRRLHCHAHVLDPAGGWFATARLAQMRIRHRHGRQRHGYGLGHESPGGTDQCAALCLLRSLRQDFVHWPHAVPAVRGE